MAAAATESIIRLTIQATVILAAVAVCLAEHEVKLKRQSLINKRPSAEYIDVKERRTVLECAKSCSLRSDCVSLFYTKTTGECQRHDTLYTEFSSGLNNEPSTVYWEKEGAATTSTSTTTTTTTAPTTTTTTTTTIPTTTTPTTTTSTITTTAAPTTTTSCTNPPPFVCPGDAVGVKEMMLPDCSIVKVRIFTDTTRSFSDVKTKCNQEGGKLYQITTLVKMDFTLNLMRCTAYETMTYWIDGEYNTGTSNWETTEGTLLPMTTGDFWDPGQPNAPGNGRCIDMEQKANFLWDDSNCPTGRIAICDMP